MTRAGSREQLIAEQSGRLWDIQAEDGHILFELEADCTIPSEYVLLCHFLGEIDPEKERRIALYLRDHQGVDGGWPLYHDGEGDISATVKVYWALKLIGDDPDAPHMKRAREFILERGGAARANVFTRYSLALFGEVPWRAVPVMPAQIMLLPQWFPFHLSKVSYWSRVVITPLLVLYSLKARAVNPTGTTIRELFVTAPEDERVYNVNPTGKPVGNLFLLLDKALRIAEPILLKPGRKRAVDEAVKFFTERLNGEDGLGAIYPAMANSVMALHALGYSHDHPDFAAARKAIDLLLVERGDQLYCQPCVSPIWDTCLAAHALMEAGTEKDDPRLESALDWLLSKEIRNVQGDWTTRRPDLEPAGWAFQFNNPHYPDVDDTAVIGLAMNRHGGTRYRGAVDRAAKWVIGMQSSSGGWGAFDPENEHYHLNSIPFADHGALLDPPTEDVTARCLSFLVQAGYGREEPCVARAIEFLKRTQQPDGSWFGRWGANYVYGTWSVLCALNAAGEDPDAPYIRKAVDWLKSRQREDGGWGEDLGSYDERSKDLCKASTPSQTAWALLALMAVGEVDSPEVDCGIAYLEGAEREGARWAEQYWTGTGFPRVFYLKYHGYAAYFPLWALARYQTLKRGNLGRPSWGM